MSNVALTLARAIHRKRAGAELPVNATLLTVFETMDAGEAKYLQSQADVLAELRKLRSEVHALKSKGDGA